MYGKSCLGVTSCHSESEILAELVSRVVDDNSLDKLQLGDRLIELTESFSGPSRDSMGLDTIYYWCHIEHEDNGEEDDLEDEYPNWDDENEV